MTLTQTPERDSVCAGYSSPRGASTTSLVQVYRFGFLTLGNMAKRLFAHKRQQAMVVNVTPDASEIASHISLGTFANPHARPKACGKPTIEKLISTIPRRRNGASSREGAGLFVRQFCHYSKQTKKGTVFSPRGDFCSTACGESSPPSLLIWPGALVDRAPGFQVAS